MYVYERIYDNKSERDHEKAVRNKRNSIILIPRIRIITNSSWLSQTDFKKYVNIKFLLYLSSILNNLYLLPTDVSRTFPEETSKKKVLLFVFVFINIVVIKKQHCECYIPNKITDFQHFIKMFDELCCCLTFVN